MANCRENTVSQTKNLVTKFAMASLVVLNLTLTVMHLDHLNAALYYCAICLFSCILVASVAINNVQSPVYKFLTLLNIVAALVLVSYIALYYSGVLEKINNVEELRKFVKESGQWGILVLFGLTLLQVVVLPIPAAVTILIGVLMYGSTVSFIVSTLGTIAGSIICFLLGKFFGYRVVAWIIGDEKAKKYADFINEKGKIPFIVMLLFPFFPDDILCMTAGLTKMTFKFFIITVALTRPVMIAFVSYFGTGDIIPFSGWGIPVWIGMFVFAVALLYFINYFIDKRKNGDKNNDKQENKK
mgnify:FL=1